jgi:hypothetical protein
VRLAPIETAVASSRGDRVGEACSLLWCVDLLVNASEYIRGPVGVAVLDRFADAFQVGVDQLREGHQPRIAIECTISSGMGALRFRQMLIKTQRGPPEFPRVATPVGPKRPGCVAKPLKCKENAARPAVEGRDGRASHPAPSPAHTPKPRPRHGRNLGQSTTAPRCERLREGA